MDKDLSHSNSLLRGIVKIAYPNINTRKLKFYKANSLSIQIYGDEKVYRLDKFVYASWKRFISVWLLYIPELNSIYYRRLTELPPIEDFKRKNRL